MLLAYGLPGCQLIDPFHTVLLILSIMAYTALIKKKKQNE